MSQSFAPKNSGHLSKRELNILFSSAFRHDHSMLTYLRIEKLCPLNLNSINEIPSAPNFPTGNFSNQGWLLYCKNDTKKVGWPDVYFLWCATLQYQNCIYESVIFCRVKLKLDIHILTCVNHLGFTLFFISTRCKMPFSPHLRYKRGRLHHTTEGLTPWELRTCENNKLFTPTYTIHTCVIHLLTKCSSIWKADPLQRWSPMPCRWKFASKRYELSLTLTGQQPPTQGPAPCSGEGEILLAC